MQEEIGAAHHRPDPRSPGLGTRGSGSEPQQGAAPRLLVELPSPGAALCRLVLGQGAGGSTARPHARCGAVSAAAKQCLHKGHGSALHLAQVASCAERVGSYN